MDLRSTASRFGRLLAGACAVLPAALVSLALIGAAGPARAQDDPPGRIGRMAEIQGTAWIFDDVTGEWMGAQRNWPLTTGDRVSVERGGRAELRVGSTTIRLDGDTDFEIRRLDDARIDLSLHRGSVAIRVRADDVADEIELATVEGRFLPRRSGHYRIDREERGTLATTWHGSLRFEGHDSALMIVGGQRAELWQEGAGGTTHYTWLEPDRDAFSDWVARDSRDDAGAAARYVSPEMTGYEDLDDYGRWESHVEYGSVWVPTVVAAGWAPYRDGRWVWVSPWGWTWVDNAPWGFAPFHYGRWVYWGNRWAWAPGVRVARPVYSPALVAWIGGPNVSVGISVGTPMVGWVPLAPYDYYRPHYRTSDRYVRHVNPWIDRHPPRQSPGVVPTGPVMYGNRGVPGAVTVVPSQVVTSRQPVAPVASRQGPEVVRRAIENLRGPREAAPPPAPSRVVPAPGGALPANRAPAWPRGRQGDPSPASRAPFVPQAAQATRDSQPPRAVVPQARTVPGIPPASRAPSIDDPRPRGSAAEPERRTERIPGRSGQAPGQGTQQPGWMPGASPRASERAQERTQERVPPSRNPGFVPTPARRMDNTPGRPEVVVPREERRIERREERRDDRRDDDRRGNGRRDDDGRNNRSPGGRPMQVN